MVINVILIFFICEIFFKSFEYLFIMFRDLLIECILCINKVVKRIIKNEGKIEYKNT